MAMKVINDREISARVRKLTLEECERQLLKKKGKLYEAVLLRLAGTVLPRLNEVTGKDGVELPQPIFNVISNNDSHAEGIETE